MKVGVFVWRKQLKPAFDDKVGVFLSEFGHKVDNQVVVPPRGIRYHVVESTDSSMVKSDNACNVEEMLINAYFGRTLREIRS